VLNILTMVAGWLRSVNVSETKELGLPIYVSDRGMGFGVVVVAVDRSPYLEFSSKRSCVRLEPLARSERNLGRTLIRTKLGLLHSIRARYQEQHTALNLRLWSIQTLHKRMNRTHTLALPSTTHRPPTSSVQKHALPRRPRTSLPPPSLVNDS
jgi:hypothetical protein